LSKQDFADNGGTGFSLCGFYASENKTAQAEACATENSFALQTNRTR
jgi:hypothetical protein